VIDRMSYRVDDQSGDDELGCVRLGLDWRHATQEEAE
jgi:hypothetical protein